MSAEVERVFSSAKRLITPDPNRLGSDTIEAVELLKDWWMNDIVMPSRRMKANNTINRNGLPS
jgi:hypothetical protein